MESLRFFGGVPPGAVSLLQVPARGTAKAVPYGDVGKSRAAA